MHETTLSYYESHAHRFFEDTRNVDMTSLYGPFLSLLPEGGRVLDAGCGSGRDSLAFLERGYEVTALDASGAMAELASRYIGRPVLRLSFDEVGFEDRFDGVWACASLLHVPRRRMPEVLGCLARSLKPGGVMYASFRYGDGESVREGRLFNDYREGTLRLALRTCPDLEPVALWHTHDLRPGRSDTIWLNVLLRKALG